MLLRGEQSTPVMASVPLPSCPGLLKENNRTALCMKLTKQLSRDCTSTLQQHLALSYFLSLFRRSGWAINRRKQKKKTTQRSSISFRFLHSQIESPDLRAVTCWELKELSAREALWARNLTINHSMSHYTRIPVWGGRCGSTTCHTDRREQLITAWLCIFLVCTSVLSKKNWFTGHFWKKEHGRLREKNISVTRTFRTFTCVSVFFTVWYTFSDTA